MSRKIPQAGPAKPAGFSAPIDPQVGFDRMEAILWPLLRCLDIDLLDSMQTAAQAAAELAEPSEIVFEDGWLHCRITTERWPEVASAFWPAVYAVRSVALAAFDAGLVGGGTRLHILDQPPTNRSAFAIAQMHAAGDDFDDEFEDSERLAPAMAG